MERRRFFLAGVIASAACVAWSRGVRGLERLQQRFTRKPSNFWTGDYFHQNNVDTSTLESGEIRARINGKWESYPVQAYHDAFMEWNIQDRLKNLETMRGGKMPDWSGAHNAAVATYGINKGDSRFTLNNAIKGTGLCPKPGRMEGLIAKLKDTAEEPHSKKFQVLESMYRDETLWDRTKLISLELYAKPDFETHTFLNQMENPVSTIVYLDIPSYELRTIARLLHPLDPKLAPLEKQYVTYINTVHTYMHVHFKAVVPAVVYHILEIFDNSPAGRGGEGKRGLRVI